MPFLSRLYTTKVNNYWTASVFYFFRLYITTNPPVIYIIKLYTAGAIPYAALDKSVPAIKRAMVPF